MGSGREFPAFGCTGISGDKQTHKSKVKNRAEAVGCCVETAAGKLFAHMGPSFEDAQKNWGVLK